MITLLDIELSVRNYRCFGDEPARIRISDGFTALIGTNNSGKSSLLRVLYELRPLLGTIGSSNNTSLLVGGTIASGGWRPNVPPGERIFRTGVDKPIELELTIRDTPKGSFTLDDQQMVYTITYDRQLGTRTSLRSEDGALISHADQPIPYIPADHEPLTSAMQELSKAMYIGPFRNAINIGTQDSYYDIQAGEAFIRSFASFKSGPFPDQNEAVFELMQEIKRIFGFRDLDINPGDEFKDLQLTVDGRSYRLAEQGAGLAHFLVVLVNVLVRRPSLLLIDEPELNLHASLQLDFLETLANYTGYGVVLATHSLGLARTAADRIYTFGKPVGETSTVRPYEADRELVTLLGQLSFDRRPDLGFSKVLLVEGKTELRALMQFLRLYGKEHEVLMLPLHGDEMIRPDVGQELSELLRIGGNVKYLIDSERSADGEALSKNRQGFVDLCAELGIGGLVLARRAIENYFTESAVKTAFSESAQALGPYDKKGSDQGWPKANNWRAAAGMSRADLDGTDLGQFLESL
jgi:ABC-type cobalamin/Fe3+-siderophores transport system ATPase subunit